MGTVQGGGAGRRCKKCQWHCSASRPTYRGGIKVFASTQKLRNTTGQPWNCRCERAEPRCFHWRQPAGRDVGNLVVVQNLHAVLLDRDVGVIRFLRPIDRGAVKSMSYVCQGERWKAHVDRRAVLNINRAHSLSAPFQPERVEHLHLVAVLASRRPLLARPCPLAVGMKGPGTRRAAGSPRKSSLPIARHGQQVVVGHFGGRKVVGVFVPSKSTNGGNRGGLASSVGLRRSTLASVHKLAVRKT